MSSELVRQERPIDRVAVTIAIDSARSLLRARPTLAQLEKAAGHLTCLADFLELDHPRWPERARLQKTRRALEARVEAAR